VGKLDRKMAIAWTKLERKAVLLTCGSTPRKFKRVHKILGKKADLTRDIHDDCCGERKIWGIIHEQSGGGPETHEH
jgi:hypothetical protein